MVNHLYSNKIFLKNSTGYKSQRTPCSKATFVGHSQASGGNARAMPGKQCQLKAWSLFVTSCGSGVHPDSGAKCEPAVEVRQEDSFFSGAEGGVGAGGSHSSTWRH